MKMYWPPEEQGGREASFSCTREQKFPHAKKDKKPQKSTPTGFEAWCYLFKIVFHSETQLDGYADEALASTVKRK